MMNKSFWDWLAYVSIAIFTIWVILKMFGVINSPRLLEYAPLLTVAYYAGWNAHKLDDLKERVVELKEKVEGRLEKVEERVEDLNKRLISVENLSLNKT